MMKFPDRRVYAKEENRRWLHTVEKIISESLPKREKGIYPVTGETVEVRKTSWPVGEWVEAEFVELAAIGPVGALGMRQPMVVAKINGGFLTFDYCRRIE
jgi:hypothetical protein